MRFLFKLVGLIFVFGFLSAANYPLKPKLTLVLVVDQLRSDYLTRFRDRLDSKGLGGLIEKGAYFPYAEYSVLQNMTGPGHSMIATGGLPYRTGIPMNRWWDGSLNREVYCVFDSEFKISPRNLKSPTLGDELKLVSEKSRVVSIALKDRAAVMMGGYGSDLTLWMDKTKGWTTSEFYSGGKLPTWVASLNQELAPRRVTEELLKTGVGNEITVDAVRRAISEMKLGAGKEMDFLWVSFSSFDYAGHDHGPTAEFMERMLESTDKSIAAILKVLEKEVPGGLSNVLIALTSDHGIPPAPDKLKGIRFPSGYVDRDELREKANAAMVRKFGSSQKPWIPMVSEMGIYIDSRVLEAKRVRREVAEVFLKSELLKSISSSLAQGVFTSDEIKRGLIPGGILKDQFSKSYYEGRSPNVFIIPNPYWIGDEKKGTHHMTGYAYDRYVPMIFYGKLIQPGVYPGGEVIDLAPTLAFLLGLTPPAISEGKILAKEFLHRNP